MDVGFEVKAETFLYLCGRGAGPITAALRDALPDSCIILTPCRPGFKSPHSQISLQQMALLARHLQMNEGVTLRDAIRRIVNMSGDKVQNVFLSFQKSREQLLAEGFIRLDCDRRALASLKKVFPRECFHWYVFDAFGTRERHPLYFRSSHPRLSSAEVLPLARCLQRSDSLEKAIRKLCAMDDTELNSLRVMAALTS